MRVLAVGAHPDDVVIGCGGTLALFSRAGDEVLLVLMTQGSRRGDPTMRAAEAAAACEVLCVSLKFGPGIDGELTPAIVDAYLEGIVADFAPDIVFTHSASDSHPDHRAVSDGVLAAARSVPTLLFFESPSAVEFTPNVYVDITDSIDAKRAAIACHKSQLADDGRVSDQITVTKAQAHGFDARVDFAESFASPRLLLNPFFGVPSRPKTTSNPSLRGDTTDGITNG